MGEAGSENFFHTEVVLVTVLCLCVSFSAKYKYIYFFFPPPAELGPVASYFGQQYRLLTYRNILGMGNGGTRICSQPESKVRHVHSSARFVLQSNITFVGHFSKMEQLESCLSEKNLGVLINSS